MTVPSAPEVRVSICVCTYRRPEVLSHLLDQLARCAAMVERRATVRVVVVDDDPERSAEPVVRGFLDRFDGDVVYKSTGSGNVAAARNRALEVGKVGTDWLALIDDDCWPTEVWLQELLSVQARTGADVVAGACDTELPPRAPRWLVEQPFNDPPSAGADGAPTHEAYVKNLLVSVVFLKRHALEFDERFGVSGGEDAVFLIAGRQRGWHMVHAAHALVWERIPPERVSLRWQLRRRFWYGNTEAITSVASGDASRPRVIGRGVKRITIGLTLPLRRVAQKQSPHFRFAISEVLRGVGTTLGGAGLWLRHH